MAGAKLENDGLAHQNKHNLGDLSQMQSLPLEVKIQMSKRRIQEWYEHFDGNVYLSFSGGKDSTVLKHLIDSVYDDIPAVFINTGLEYPEIQKFVRDIKHGEYDCFNPNVVILRPEMRFDEVIKKYGYPIISKSVSRAIHYARTSMKSGNSDSFYMRQLNGEALDNQGRKSLYNKKKWRFLLDAPFDMHNACCDVMKKKPFHEYQRQTKRKPYIGTLATESMNRRNQWMAHGCNSFDSRTMRSAPLSFWTEQDILAYIIQYNVPYSPIYGDIIIDKNGKYNTTELERTGCIFCGYGCHLEKSPNRFQKLKETHPRQYEYCIGGGEMIDGKWKPNKDGLGLGKVLDYINVPYE